MAQPTENTAETRNRPHHFKRWLRGFAIKAAIAVVLLVGLVGFAENHTSKPEFCGSCHIMDPYYETWQADLHGQKIGATCVDCHYAPGERTTITAKLRGLSQVTSYFSGRYGATRPRAHVSNDSCMTAKCHGDLQFMEKEIMVGTVNFKHAKHLRFDDAKRQAVETELAEVTKSIQNSLGDAKRFETFAVVANEATRADRRIAKLSQLAKEWHLELSHDEIERFSQLTHRGVRIAQLDDLQCTNCHSYAPPEDGLNGAHAKHHFSVSTTACYTCHFNNEGFNTGTAKCLLCHNLPTKDVTIHQEVAAKVQEKLDDVALGQGPVKMNHQTILERKVDCRSCHADVASDDALVTRRDCQRCHDQPHYFENWKTPFTLDQVVEYHRLHVPNQHAKCLDCHAEIHHQLVREAPTSQAGFLAASMANCNQCHPNQHAAQINLLRGVGGSSVPKGDANMMFGSRTNCYGCHTEHVLDEQGAQVMKATENGCIACHGDKHVDTFEKWKLGLEFSLTDAEEAYASAKKMFDEAGEMPEESRQKIAKLLQETHGDLMLVKGGNGLHNVMYSMELLDAVTSRCQQAMAEMAELAGSQ